MNRSITGGKAEFVGADQVLELRVNDAQLVVIQADSEDALMAYSREGLAHESSRFKLSQFLSADGTQESGLVLTFPLKPYTGSFFFASTSGTISNISLLQVGCGSVNKMGY